MQIFLSYIIFHWEFKSCLRFFNTFKYTMQIFPIISSADIAVKIIVHANHVKIRSALSRLNNFYTFREGGEFNFNT